MNDERFDKHAAAAYLSRSVTVSPRTLDAWRAADKGPRSHKVAGRVFWYRSECDRWLASELLTSSRGGVR